MRTFTGLDLAFKLLKGEVSGSELETLLSNPLYLGPWRELMKTTELNAILNNSTALTSVFDSATAFESMLTNAGDLIASRDDLTALVSNSSSAILTVISNPDYIAIWDKNSETKARIRARVNASGSKLKRYVFTASGTLTLPVGYQALSVALVGAGGRGGYADAYAYSSDRKTRSGPGGGGGEVKTKVFSTLPAAGSIAITIQSGDGNQTDFGGLLTAQNGTDATDGDGNQSTQSGALYNGVGGGSDSSPELIRVDLEDEIFQLYDASKKGGDGGASVYRSWYASGSTEAQKSGHGLPGENGLGDTGGGLGGQYVYNTSADGGHPGTAYGAGGGAAGVDLLNMSSGGYDATVPGAGGGGGGDNIPSEAPGNGGTGLAVAYLIEG